MTPAGLEPAIPGSVGRCLIHWATGPSASWASFQIQKRSKAKAKSKYLASSFGTLMPRGDDCFAMRKPKGAQENMRHVSLLQVGAACNGNANVCQSIDAAGVLIVWS